MAPYPEYPVPADEFQRLRSLERHGLLDTASEPYLELILKLATDILETPIGLISLVDESRQWFLSSRGLEARETPREMAFCAHAIVGDEVLIVPDAREDERFSNNPLVVEGPRIRFYAGVPLRSRDGYNLGTLCVIDQETHQPTARQLAQLELIASLAMHALDMRYKAMLCPVTGVFNRHAFFSFGDREINHARERRQALSLLNVSIDNLRQTYDRWGHGGVDKVMEQLAQLCRKLLQEQDLIGKASDEGFSLLLIDREEGAVMRFAHSIYSAAVAMSGVYTNAHHHLRVSVGVTVLGQSDQTFEDLFRRAYQASVQAKGEASHRVVFIQ